MTKNCFDLLPFGGWCKFKENRLFFLFNLKNKTMYKIVDYRIVSDNKSLVTFSYENMFGIFISKRIMFTKDVKKLLNESN